MIPTLAWTPEGVRFIDQTKLPLEESRAGRRRGGDDAIPSGVSQPPERCVQLGLDVFVHLVNLPHARRIVLEKCRVQADRTEWFRVRFHQLPSVGGDDLGAATADIDHQDPLGALRPNAPTNLWN